MSQAKTSPWQGLLDQSCYASDNLVVADVHQCPFCELKFLNRSELEFHWAEDHPPAEDEVEPPDIQA